MLYIINVLFLYSLFENIQEFSKSKGYLSTFSSVGYFIGFIGLNLAGRLPEPLSLISFLSVLFLIPALESLNFGIKNSGEYKIIETENFNNRQIGLIVAGGLLWILILISMFAPIE